MDQLIISLIMSVVLRQTSIRNEMLFVVCEQSVQDLMKNLIRSLLGTF